MVKAKPEGYHTITPYLIFKGAAEAIEYYKTVFGAVEMFRMNGKEGNIGHAEIQVGDSKIMLSDECVEREAKGPFAFGGSPISIHLYVDDADAVLAKAEKAGAKIIRPMTLQFYGDKNCLFEDPFGYRWCVSTHVEDVSPEEVGRRAAALMS